MAARHRISKLLLRRGQVWNGPGETWSTRHLQWLSGRRFDDPLADVVLGEYLGCHEVLLARRDRLDGLIAQQAVCEPWAGTVARLRCLRGVDTLTAVGLLAEIGDLAAFAHPKQLASFVGLVPAMPVGCSSKRHGTTAVRPASHRPCAVARPASPPRRSTRRGALSSDCTAAGSTSTAPGARSAPPSRRRSPASWPALSGRSPASKAEQRTSPFEAEVAADACHPGTAMRL
jgi:transposase IS116/IS110/IS902 family protein